METVQKSPHSHQMEILLITGLGASVLHRFKEDGPSLAPEQPGHREQTWGTVFCHSLGSRGFIP